MGVEPTTFGLEVQRASPLRRAGICAHTFRHLSTRSLFRKLLLLEYHRQPEDKLLKNQGRTQYILPLNI